MGDTLKKQYLKQNEILILLQAIENGEIETIYLYINDEKLKEKIQRIFDEDRFNEERDNIEKEYLANIASQISKDDYSFLEARISNQVSRDLLCATGDIEYLKKCVDTLDLEMRDKIFFVSATKDEQYIKDFFYKHKDELESWQKANLIKATRDDEFIKQCVEDDSLGLTESLKAGIVSSIGDTEYIKDFISKNKLNSRLTWSLIVATKDTKYIIDKIENSDTELLNREIIKILKKLNDQEIIKYFLSGSRLEIEDKIKLIVILKDTEYIKQFINSNKEQMNKDNLIQVIPLTKDFDFIYRIINEQELELSDNEKAKIIMRTKDKGFIQRYLREKPNLSDEAKKMFELIINPNYLSFERVKYKRIDLPKGMTIGIEIESEGEYSTEIPKIILNGQWKSKTDNSLENGVEIVSTILDGSEQDSKEIYQICEFLNEIGQSTSERCGAHIHIGADFLTNKQAYINLLEIYGNCEEIIYAISNESGSTIRRGISQYCLPIAAKLEEGIENGTLDSETEIDRFIEQLQMIQEDRSAGINFMNIGTIKNTIEFRTPNGTINPDVWIENINLFGGMVRVAQELSVIQAKKGEKITDEDKLKMMYFSKLKSPDIDLKDKLNALLSLIVKDKEPYIDRYNKNMKLMQEDEKISKTMKKARLHKPLDIRRIGRSVLAGSDAVRGEEVVEVEGKFYRDVEKVKEGEQTYE